MARLSQSQSSPAYAGGLPQFTDQVDGSADGQAHFRPSASSSARHAAMIDAWSVCASCRITLAPEAMHACAIHDAARGTASSARPGVKAAKPKGHSYASMQEAGPAPSATLILTPRRPRPAPPPPRIAAFGV